MGDCHIGGCAGVMLARPRLGHLIDGPSRRGLISSIVMSAHVLGVAEAFVPVGVVVVARA
jgi:hypothetical protein